MGSVGSAVADCTAALQDRVCWLLHKGRTSIADDCMHANTSRCCELLQMILHQMGNRSLLCSVGANMSHREVGDVPYAHGKVY